MRVSFKKLFTRPGKLKETLKDIREGRLSFTRLPIIVSKLDSPRGTFFILDGHHRVVESFLSNKKGQEIIIDRYVPRIERTGGGYSEYIKDKVNVYDWLNENINYSRVYSKKRRK